MGKDSTIGGKPPPGGVDLTRKLQVDKKPAYSSTPATTALVAQLRKGWGECGPPTLMTIEDGLALMNRLNEQARNTGKAGTQVAGWLTGGSTTHGAKQRDDLVKSVNQQYAIFRGKGTLGDRELGLLNRSINDALNQIALVNGDRRQVVRIVASSGTAVALTAAAPFTAGTSLLGVASLGAVGAGARVALNGTMEGSRYTKGQLVEDTVLGGAQGVAQGLTADVTGEVAGRFVAEGVEKVAGATTARIVNGAVQGGVKAGTSGAAYSAATQGATKENWKDGAVQGVKQLVVATAKGGVASALLGGTAGGALAARQVIPQLKGGGTELPDGVEWKETWKLTTMNPTKRLHASPGNAGFGVDTLAKRIAEEGYDATKPILLADDGVTIMAGQHRFLALKQLGITQVPVRVARSGEELFQWLAADQLATGR